MRKLWKYGLLSNLLLQKQMLYVIWYQEFLVETEKTKQIPSTRIEEKEKD